jgi:predicted O-methyltransferase YrrM
MKLLKPGGIFITDNVLWSGRVLSEEPDENTKGIQEFNRKLFNSDGIISSIIPIRDGLGLAVKI